MWEKLKIAEKKVTEFRSSYKTCKQELSIENEDTVYHLIKDHAYNHDAMWMTLRKANANAKVNQNKKIEVIKWLQEEIKKSNINSKEAFDEWHENICDKLTNRINKEVLPEYEDIQIGKAQKIINMTFKYLSSLDGAEKYNWFFEYCHVPLDSIILAKYYTIIYPAIHPVEEKKNRIKKIEWKTWSNLKYKGKEERDEEEKEKQKGKEDGNKKDGGTKSEHKIYEYFGIQKDFREYCSREQCGPPLLWEWINWGK